MSFRIGSGFDVHKISQGSGIYLGGTFIASNIALIGHSDADVLIHAICDAIYGSLNCGDIGEHFPDNLEENKGRSSSDFLKHAMDLLKERGYRVVNLDTTIICETPKITAYKKGISESLAAIMNISSDQVNIKATTTEKLGFTGRSEGIAAQAVVLIEKL